MNEQKDVWLKFVQYYVDCNANVKTKEGFRVDV